ncbi:hypothetical protein QJS10_CPA05g00208 [Acorus calamus]|uniref:DUF7787 domain-containing protein n=1 Tax=Acorus calamus TaxID=4465 RepID=A0AAV9EQL1_ACOCL|nr:hypothetical protein QJS10_CPA05g00208 [Acorus calamus]
MKEKGKLTMEGYADFYNDPDFDLTIKQLNQILLLNGYMKIHKRTKKDVLDALAMVEMVCPLRSTIRDSNSIARAPISVDQVTRDIDDLGWRECPIRSVESIFPVIKDDGEVVLTIKAAGGGGDETPPVGASATRRKRKAEKLPRRRYLKKMRAIADVHGRSCFQSS